MFNSGDDHLYGMDGNDTLNGAAGNDYIEGGRGQDTMNGGSGNDTFFVMGEEQDYDIFIGGEGTDIILGSDKDDTIRVHNLYSLNSIERIDGGSGTNVIAGTGGDDFIDLTGISVSNIDKIQGGWGDDKITGTAADDRIYGGENSDTLKGMAGNDILFGIGEDGRDDHMIDRLEGGAGQDTYHVGAGDIVVDTDNQGTIFFNGKQLAAGTLTQIYKDQQYYESEDNSYRAILDNTTGTLSISVGYNPNSFSIENFSSGSYGITLKEYRAPPRGYNFNITGSLRQDEMRILDFGSDPSNWRLVVTAGTGEGNSNTLFNKPLSAATPHMEIFGGYSDDYLFGFTSYDHIDGGAGNDIIIGSLGSWNGKPVYPAGALEGDLLEGGAGNDWIAGTGGDDQIHGGEGSDIIQSYDGNDYLSGDAGNDVLAGGSGDAVLMGGEGDDALFGDGYFTGSGAITLDNIDQFYLTCSYADEGFAIGYNSVNFFVQNDAPAAGNDFLDGGAGRDLLHGGAGNDTLLGGDGHDSLTGGSGNDLLKGGSGNDLLTGDNSDQLETAGDGDDYLYGGSGNDYLYGMGGDDVLFGDADEDYLSGGGGQDYISGGSADDSLFGDSGDDTLNGDQGMDVLYGNQGNDTLNGGSGNDYLAGGDGNDTYQLGPGSGYDIIADNSGSTRLRFGEGITAAQIKISQVRKLGDSGSFEFTDQGRDLWVEYSASDAVYIESGMDSPNLSIEFSNGELLNQNQLQILLAESQNELDVNNDTQRRVDSIINGSASSPKASATLVMGNGYDAYNAPSLRGLYNYFRGMIGDLEPGQPMPTSIKLGNAGGAASWTWNVADFLLSIRNNSSNSSFSSAKDWRVRRDPLVLDLDGDGLETVGTVAGVLFDHNGDGIKTGSGWLEADDGLLVRDNNHNGIIDNGSELFGDQTMLQNGATATTGFAALGDLDSNIDGKIDAGDEAFAELKIWRDINQDGVSQASELDTLTDFGIAALNLESYLSWESQNGNAIDRAGSFTRVDQTTGSVFDVNLAENLLARQFTDQIEVSESVIVLPELLGGGKVRNLQEAMTLSPELQDVLTRYTQGDNRAAQMALLDELLVKWADTSGMAGSLAERVSSQYRVEYMSFGNVQRYSHLSEITGNATAGGSNVENTLIDEEYRHLIQQWDDRIHVLEAFNGSYFFELPGQSQEGGGAMSGMQIDNSGNSALFGADTSKTGLVIQYSSQQLSQLEAAYQELRQSVYGSLCLQTRLKGYLDQVALVLAEDSISFDFSRIRQSFRDKIAADPTNGLTDLIEFNKYTTGILSGTSWDGVVIMEEILRSQSLTPEQVELCRELDVLFDGIQVGDANNNIIVGDASNRPLSGRDGNDILLGGSGNSSVVGGNGDDIISGGGGEDLLFGEEGNDTYIFRRGSGSDVVHDFQGKNSIVFADLNPEDITVINSSETNWNLIFRINETGETLTSHLCWNGGKITSGLDNTFFFADGTVWDMDEHLRQSVKRATEGDDIIFGSPLSDSIFGLAGDDVLVGNSGDDIIDGGPGDDNLLGGDGTANGNDTYLFGRGDGHDIIIDSDTTPNTDRLKLKDDILPEDVAILRDQLNLVLTIKNTDDRIILQNYFAERSNWIVVSNPYEIEEIEFADGTIWTTATIKNVLLAGSENPETIIGYRGDDVIIGREGDDSIEARGGNDSIFGGIGNDIIRAGLGNDLLDGGAGDDILDGNGNKSGFYDSVLLTDSADNDSYMFGWGDGHDTIRDYDWRPGNEDTLHFKTGVSVEEVFFERIDNSSEDLLIGLGEGADSITVEGWFRYNCDSYKIECIDFADGTVFNPAYVDSHLSKIGTMDNDILYGSKGSETFFGFDGDDTLYGRDGDDSFDGGSGDDLLDGGKGNDSYLFNRGSGRDAVIEDPANLDDIDTIILGPDILPADVTLRLTGTDLTLSINDTEDRLIIKNFFNADDPAKTIEQLRFANGQVWNQNDLQLRAIVMTIGDETSVGDDIIFGTPNVDTLIGGTGNDLLFGLEGDDYLDAGAHRDWLDGGTGNDTLSGGSGDDVLFGGAGDDSLLAGPGNDIAWGGRGNDTYIFHAGDGNLTIEDNYLEEPAASNNDYGADYGGGFDYGGALGYGGDYGGDYSGDYGGPISSVNVLQFGPGIIISDLVFSEKEGYLIIDIPASGDQIRLAGYAPDRPTFTNAVDFFRFSDGSIASRQSLLARGVPITGTSSDDVFSGTPGDDYLAGGSGNDQYFFNIGDGIDTIVDTSTVGMENSIQFGYPIVPDDIQAVVENGTLVLRVGASGDAIRFDGYDPAMAEMPPPVGQFDFWNGTSLSFADFLRRGYEIVGTPEQDNLMGTAGSDRIRGLAGNDLLNGGTGDDTYLFEAGDGVDTIDDIAGPGEGNTVVLPDEYTMDNIRLSHDPDSATLILTATGSQNEIHLTGFDRLNPMGDRAVQFFQFGPDGAILAYEDLLARGFDIEGGDDNDTLLGTAVADRIYGGAGDDVLTGGRGNDLLFGQSGNDTYVFNPGDGIVHIKDQLEPGAGNIVRFGVGIEPLDLRRHLYFESPANGAEGTLIIAFDNGDELWLAGFNPDDVENSPRSVETFLFDDGTTLSFAELAASTFVVDGDINDNSLSGTNLGDRLYGRDGNDILAAGMGDDVLTGGTGNDEMAGGTGRDVYAVALGDGHDRIIDAVDNGIGNTLLFGQGISRDEIVLIEDGNTLTIRYGTLGDQVQIANFDPAGINGSLVVDTFEFADGSSVSYQEFINQAPQVIEREQFIMQDMREVSGRLSASDPDSEVLYYALKSAPNHGSFVVDGQGAWQYRADPLFLGIDAAVVSVGDGQGGVASTILDFEVMVTPPVLADQALILSEDDSLSGSLVVANPAGGAVDFKVMDNAGHGIFSLDDDGSWSYVPDKNFHGRDTIRVMATNEYGLNSFATLAMTVSSVNDAPLVRAEEQFVMLGLPVLGGRIDAVDVDGDNLQYGVAVSPSHGSITINDQGQWQYTPTTGYCGEDWAEVSISDGASDQKKTTLRFLVNTYVEGALNLPEKTIDTLHLKDIGKADLAFRRDGNALMIDIRQKGSVQVNGYFLAPDKGIRCIETSDGPLQLERDHIGNMQSLCSALNSTIHGFFGDNLLISGTENENALLGGAQNDVILGAGGGDSILGLRGDDLIVGGGGNDKLFGNGGNDTVYGDQDNDYLDGGTGNDFLIGGDGNDQLSGGSQNDHLNGGLGNDILTGGRDNDTFVFDTVPDALTNKDTIIDFVAGQDQIELDTRIFSALSGETSLFSQYFHTTPTGVAGDDNDYLLYNTTSGALLYDMDGNGQGVAVEFATLVSKPGLTAKDFVLAS